MHTSTPPNSISDGPVTDLLSILCILIEILSHAHAHAKGAKKSLRGFRVGTSFGNFPSDGAASKVVKGFNLTKSDQRKW